MATLILKLPEEATNQLRAIPESLKQKIEKAAEAKGLGGGWFLLKLMTMLQMPRDTITQDRIERDILDELQLYFDAFNGDTLGESRKWMDFLNEDAVQIDSRGVARIAGTRMKVAHIAEEHTRLGMTPEQIVEAHPHLSLAQVSAALAYYYGNREAIEAEIVAALAYADQARRQAGLSPLAARLRGLKAPLGIDSGPASFPAPTRNPENRRVFDRTEDGQ